MTRPAGGRRNRAAPDFQCRTVSREERETTLAWLNRGLREGRKQRLEAEFPTALFSHDPDKDLLKHVLVYAGRNLASHVLVHSIPVEARGQRVELGMIGMVYTDPAFRGRGAAKIGLEQAVLKMKARGIPLAILWSDLDAFYNRQGFDRAGVENFYLLNASQCLRAANANGESVEVRRVNATDWRDLERLYAAKSCRHLRPAGDLARLASAPDCETLVATRAGVVVAYASMGRGDDLTGVVHEWAGTAEGLVGCLKQFTQSRDEITLLEGPVHEAATRPFRVIGARPHPGSLGLMRILDVEKLWSTLSSGCESLAKLRLVEERSAARAFRLETPHGQFRLSHRDTLSLLFGPSVPQALNLGLDANARLALQKRFPWPLFLWGFDSI